jgi:flagellar hook-basal body complex protein FliE
MNVNFGNLELNRTNSAHLGTSPLGVTKVGGQDEKSSAQKPSFESFLMDAVNEMNRQQMEVSAIQEKVITDPDSVDIHDVTVAMAKAQSSLNLAQTVIDRLVKGWNDLSQNR